MKIKFLSLFVAFASLFLVSCGDDDTSAPLPFVVAFENPSVSLSQTDTATPVNLVFSRTSTEVGTITISYTLENTVYGTDFTTSPDGSSGTIMMDIASGTDGTSFTFNKLLNAVEGGDTKTVTFNISNVVHESWQTGGNTSTIINFSEAPALGGVAEPTVGGSNEGNQVFVDLSSQTMTESNREAWDLGFYGGSDFRVAINGSLFMAAGETNFTDIDAVTAADVADLQPMVAVGTFNPANEAYIDAPNGDIMGTAIAEISATDSENKVYLLNMGSEVGTVDAEPGGVEVSGDPRGWKKIRILRNGSDYLLQFADLDSNTHNEVTISKDDAYNFTFYSIVNEELATVQPEKDAWDMCFTVFTNVITGFGSYGYSDFVVTNRNGNVTAYQVNTTDFAYADFTMANVDSSMLSNDQRAIGSNWRQLGPDGGSLYEDRFFVLKDSDNNYYKIRFTALVNESGERGHPAFEYSLL